MKIAIAGPLPLCLLAGAACALPTGPTDDPTPMTPSSPIASRPPTEPLELAAADDQGRLVVASAATGAVRRVASVSGRIDDLVWDPWTGRLLLVDAGEDEGGEIAAYAADLGARTHLAWLDGRARLLATPFGALLFEQGHGERWRLLGAAPSASVLAPPPTSAWLSTDGASLHAFGPGAERRDAALGASGIGAPVVAPLPEASSHGRLVATPALGEAALVEVAPGAVVVRLVQGAAVGPPHAAPVEGPPARIEAALGVGGGVVLALLGAEPTALLAVGLGEQGTVTGVARLALPGVVTAEGPLLSRALDVAGTTVLAATSAGVHAARVAWGAAGVRLEPVPGFAGTGLRAPLAVLRP